MQKLPEGKLLQGNFMTVNHGFAVALGKAAANTYLQNFVKELIETGFVARSIEKYQIKGLIAINPLVALMKPYAQPDWQACRIGNPLARKLQP